jgi:BNR/Asp-box repeat
MSGTNVMVMVGTRKGGFIFNSDKDREQWSSSEILFKGWNMMHMNQDLRDGRLHAAVSHFVYGPTTHYSDDLGKTWTQASTVPAFSRPSISGRPVGTPEEAFSGNPVPDAPEEVIRVWNIQPGRADEPGVLYAGIQPAALFKSTDRGENWSLNESLYDHPHRGQWMPGAGGLCLHTIMLDPLDKNRVYVGISAAGVYRTDDGGQSWQPRNKNVLADFAPEKYPEFGQCVHKLDMHPSQPQVLYQQNHCGVYRSTDYGDDWTDIGIDKLPSRFGFPIAVHPHDPQTVYIVLEESDQYRMSVGGQFAVWRSRDGGESWERLTEGLPRDAHLLVLREAMATDNLDRAGIYVGTENGQLFYSRDDGDSWQTLADYLPPILSVEVAVV